MLMANAVQQLSAKTPGKEAMAMEAFAKSLRQVRWKCVCVCVCVCVAYNSTTCIIIYSVSYHSTTVTYNSTIFILYLFIHSCLLSLLIMLVMIVQSSSLSYVQCMLMARPMLD